ncbi:MAG: nucleoside deaminase [Nanoarchaeota archaeon]|nr:nucleoside deaminase [Nanoarchaeota archaeon]MBU1027829.1 nucleoside deaminase [Nanoarchaeota archaeon]
MKKEEFMCEAIKDAKKSKHHFGAVVVKGNKIIAHMGKRPAGDPRYHAETQALLNATNKLKTKTLKGCTLYSTCEPCPMCFYMAWITGISKIIYGANINDALKHGFKQINISNQTLNKKSGNKIKLEKGFMRKECLELFN